MCAVLPGWGDNAYGMIPARNADKKKEKKMMMKKGMLIAFIIVCLISVQLAFAGGSRESGTDGVYTLKFGHDQMEDTPHHMAAVRFKELVEERTDGHVQVTIFPAQQLGSAREEVEGLQIGTVEGVALPTSAFASFDLATGLVDLPFLFPDPETAYEVLDSEVGDKILARLEPVGMTGAAFWTSGFKQFTANFPIETPADFHGKKIRVMANPVLISQYEAMGASAVPIDFNELYNALQQGAVDGEENPFSTIVNMRFYEVQEYIPISNHGMLGYIVAFSSNWLSSLPKEYQEIIIEAAKEAAPYERELIAELETERYLPTIIDFGCVVTELTEEQRALFREVTAPAYDVFAGMLDDSGRALLKEVQDAVAALE